MSCPFQNYNSKLIALRLTPTEFYRVYTTPVKLFSVKFSQKHLFDCIFYTDETLFNICSGDELNNSFAPGASESVA